jgi:glycosyltransferase involved in cell wall biosynthesis
LFAVADVVVLPSHTEPWGLVVNEALSSGRPVMAPHWVGAAADLLQDGVTGLVLSANSPEAIAAGLERALEMRATLSEMGRRGRALVAEGGWTLEGALSSWHRVLREELGPSLPPSTDS